MKFIITESRLYGAVLQYLDFQNFVQEIEYKSRGDNGEKLIFNYPGSKEFPIYYNFEKRNLYIDTEFVTELMSIFRLEKDIIMDIIDEWFYIKTENKIGIRNTNLFMRVDY
jgi:hypothetical protein